MAQHHQAGVPVNQRSQVVGCLFNISVVPLRWLSRSHAQPLLYVLPGYPEENQRNKRR